MSICGMFYLLKDFITAMTFVTDDEQRILHDAIQKAESEGKSLMMPYCREKKVSLNIDVTATDANESASEKNARESSPVPETVKVEEQRQIKANEGDSEQRQSQSDGDKATDANKDILRGKPYITDVKTIKSKLYVNKNMISKFNLKKENLASKNKNIDNNCSAVIQEQLQNIALKMQEFSNEIMDLKEELRSESKANDERLERVESQIKETMIKVWKNNNQTIDRSDSFSDLNIYNSTALAPEVKKLNNDEISNLIQKELNKINLESSKNRNVTTDVSRELRNTIRAEFMTKDSNVRREYKLTSQTKFEHFMDFFEIGVEHC